MCTLCIQVKQWEECQRRACSCSHTLTSAQLGLVPVLRLLGDQEDVEGTGDQVDAHGDQEHVPPRAQGLLEDNARLWYAVWRWAVWLALVACSFIVYGFSEGFFV